MPVVAVPTDDAMPRIEILVESPHPLRIESPGVVRARSAMLVTLSRSSRSRSDAATLSGTEITLESRRVAVTIISTMDRSEEHTSELQSLMPISYAVFFLTKKQHKPLHHSMPPRASHISLTHIYIALSITYS